MNHRIQQLRAGLRHIKPRSIAAALAALLLATLLSAFIGGRFHSMQREILFLTGERNAQQAAKEYDRYLLARVNIVKLVGYTVDKMLADGADNGAIESYITEETNYIIGALDPGTTGLYGWFNGAYLDGAGWVPDEDYVATERPWYIQTLHSGKEITCVEPYVDMLTGTMMMTVAMLLHDGQSVLAMDVTLDPVQSIIEQVSSSTEGGQAFLLDDFGVVVAHSNQREIGKNYLEAPDSPGGLVAQRLLYDGEMQFEIETPRGEYEVYIDALEGGWYSVSLINADVWHRSLHRAVMGFSVILLFLIVCIIGVFLHLTAKNAALMELHRRFDQEERRGERLRELSETDRMTGLNDRVSGERKVCELLAADRRGMFLELDIDKFKAVNDTCGHQAGDCVIVAVAEALRSTFSSDDVAMRLGGDEFGVFAVGIVSQEMGRAIVRRLFNRLENLDIPALRGEKLSVSVGAALCPEEKALSFHELYAIADGAMYESKSSPGNSLTFAAQPASR